MFRSMSAFAWLGFLCLLFSGLKTAHADFPADLAPSTVDATAQQLNCDKEVIGGPFPGLLLTPREARNNKDEKYQETYHAISHVYIAERSRGSDTITNYSQRFLVYGAEDETRPLIFRAAKLLLLLWGENHSHLRRDHVPDKPTIQVWLTEHPARGLTTDVGGEEFESPNPDRGGQIYLYNVHAERRSIEWTREIAHEYGHYALPGISGFKSPEVWANGVLGERLFLKWLDEDLHSGVLKPEEIPFVTPDQLDDFLARQVTPLIRRVQQSGMSNAALARTDAEGMDNYTALALYVDTLYGSSQLLSAMSYTTPGKSGVLAEAPDFLRGVTESLRNANEFSVLLPLQGKENTSIASQIYLPSGEFHVVVPDIVHSWQVTVDLKKAEVKKDVRTLGKDDLLVTAANWCKLTVTLSGPAEAPVRIVFHRRGTELQ